MQSLGITGLSKSQVSVMARDLDELVRDFRERPLDEGPYNRGLNGVALVTSDAHVGLVEGIGANLPVRPLNGAESTTQPT